jgi:DNA-binding response OmpR family regulator
MVLKRNHKQTGSILLLTAGDIFQEMLVGILKLERYYIALAQDTKQALEKAETEDIDIILIDEAFLVVNYIEDEFILKLKGAGLKASIVLMVTPDPKGKLLIHKLLSSGNIEDCIFKPFLPQSLISLITNVIIKNKKKSERVKKAAPVSVQTEERRKFIRGNVPTEVFLSYIDKFLLPPTVIEQKTKSNDISVAGMQFDVSIEMNIPTYLDLKVFLPPEEPIWVTGQVMWERANLAEKTKSIGIYFVNMKPSDSQAISNHIIAK